MIMSVMVNEMLIVEAVISKEMSKDEVKGR